MTFFVVVVVLLVVAALVFVIPPLLQRRSDDTPQRQALNIQVYRDQMVELERDLENDVISRDQYEAGRLELESRLLEDVSEQERMTVAPTTAGARKTAWLLGLFLPLFAGGLYFYIGNPRALDIEQAVREQIGQMSQQDIAAQIEGMVAQLARRLEENPNDAEGWKMLGRSYIALQRFDEALRAMEKAVSLDGSDAQLLADYADALAMASGETLEGRPMELIRRALELDPNNQKALWLAGTAAYERADFPEALEYWQRLYALVPPNSQAARSMERNIAEAKALLAAREGEDAANATGAITQAPGAGMDGAPISTTMGLQQVSGVVTLDPALAERVAPQDTVYVFARALGGSSMPLAVIRAQVKDLPLDFTLDDGDAIDPAMSLSQFSQVEVVARISRSGDAIPRSGDLQGSSGVVSAAQTARVVIDEVIP